MSGGGGSALAAGGVESCCACVTLWCWESFEDSPAKTHRCSAMSRGDVGRLFSFG